MRIEDLIIKWERPDYAEVWYPDGSMAGYIDAFDRENNWMSLLFEKEEWGIPHKVMNYHKDPTEALISLFDHLRMFLKGIPVMDRSYPRFPQGNGDPISPLCLEA